MKNICNEEVVKTKQLQLKMKCPENESSNKLLMDSKKNLKKYHKKLKDSIKIWMTLRYNRCLPIKKCSPLKTNSKNWKKMVLPYKLKCKSF